MTLSIDSYTRAFAGQRALKAVGDYTQSPAASKATVILGILTLGLGYGIVKLYELYNSNVKAREFAKDARELYTPLAELCAKLDANEYSFTVDLPSGHTLRMSDKPEGVELQLDNDDVLIPGLGVKRILSDLNADIIENPAWYHSQGWRILGDVPSINLLVRALDQGANIDGAKIQKYPINDGMNIYGKSDLLRLLDTQVDLHGACFVGELTDTHEIALLTSRGIEWRKGV